LTLILLITSIYFFYEYLKCENSKPAKIVNILSDEEAQEEINELFGNDSYLENS